MTRVPRQGFGGGIDLPPKRSVPTAFVSGGFETITTDRDGFPIHDVPAMLTMPVDDFEDYSRAAVKFLRIRRLAPFLPQLADLERVVLAEIEERKEGMEPVARGEPFRHFLELKLKYWWQFENQPYPREVQEFNDHAQLPAFLREAVGKSPRDLMDYTLAYMGDIQFLCAELLRHARLLPEQQAIFQSRRGIVGMPVPEWYRQPERDSKLAQMVRFMWVAAWGTACRAFSYQSSVDQKEWMQWYAAVVKIVHHLEEYTQVKDYAIDLAQLAYDTATGPVLKFLGGVLLASVAYREDQVRTIAALRNELAPLLPEVMRPENQRYLREGKTAWRAVPDEEGLFIFKTMPKSDALLLDTIHAIVRDPVASHWRVASFMTDLSRPQNIESTVEEVRVDASLSRYFELRCVRPTGIMLPIDADTSLVAMEHAGETLADRVRDARSVAKKQTLYDEAIDMLQQFHLLVSEAALKVGDRYYLAQYPQLYTEYPRLPVVDYAALVRSKLVGTPDHPRLGENRFLDLVMREATCIASFLHRGCEGVTTLDTDETNFARDGLIDLTPHWGNVCWDVARFLYGGSFLLKQGIDRQALRERYITRVITIMLETSLLNGVSGSLEWVQAELDRTFSCFRTRQEFIDDMKRLLEPITPSASLIQKGLQRNLIVNSNPITPPSPAMPEDVREALIAHSAYTAALDWDYCRKDSRTDIIAYTQAAAILMSMAEVGSIWNQLQHAHPGSPSRDHWQAELEMAVPYSMTLMCRQGFTDMAGCWMAYLAESGKIPSGLMHETPDLSDVVVPDLHQRILEASSPSSSRVYVPNLDSRIAMEGVARAVGRLILSFNQDASSSPLHSGQTGK